MLGESENSVVLDMSQPAFERLLIEKQVVNIGDLKSLLPNSFKSGNGALLVNLFDCLGDPCYVKDILSLPHRINEQFC